MVQYKAVKYLSSLTTVKTTRNSSQELGSLVLLLLASGCNKARREPYVLATQSVIFFDDWHPVSLHFLSLFARQLLLLWLNTPNLPWIFFFSAYVYDMCICTKTVIGSFLIFSITQNKQRRKWCELWSYKHVPTMQSVLKVHYRERIYNVLKVCPIWSWMTSPN